MFMRLLAWHSMLAVITTTEQVQTASIHIRVRPRQEGKYHTEDRSSQREKSTAGFSYQT